MSTGTMKVSLKNENGRVLTREYGFTVEEENKILSFDLHEHPDLGTMVLFGDQVFSLRYWKNEDLEKGKKILEEGFKKELERRSHGVK